MHLLSNFFQKPVCVQISKSWLGSTKQFEQTPFTVINSSVNVSLAHIANKIGIEWCKLIFLSILLLLSTLKIMQQLLEWMKSFDQIAGIIFGSVLHFSYRIIQSQRGIEEHGTMTRDIGSPKVFFNKLIIWTQRSAISTSFNSGMKKLLIMAL